MSNEIATLSGLTSLAVPVAATSTDLTAYSTGVGEFLQNIRLFGKGKYVERGLIPPGHYGILMSKDDKDKIIDLGDSIDVLLWASRDKALDHGADPPVVCYDKKDPVFQDIAERADTLKMESKCLYGPSILLFERRTKKLYEWFIINQSSREEAPKLRPFFPIFQNEADAFGIEPRDPIPCTLSAKFIERKKGSWYIPVITKCSTPFDYADLPPNETLEQQIIRFVTATQEAKKLAEEGGDVRDV